MADLSQSLCVLYVTLMATIRVGKDTNLFLKSDCIPGKGVYEMMLQSSSNGNANLVHEINDHQCCKCVTTNTIANTYSYLPMHLSWFKIIP